jgi:hypothetical protein
MMTRDELQRRIEDCGVSAGNGPAGAGWGIMQNPAGLADFLAAMQALNVRRVLELGTGPTGGLARFMQMVLGWDVVSVDIARPTPPPTWDFIELPTEEAKGLFRGGEFDMVFIDADGYQVCENHAWYAHTARIVAIHDICSPDPTAPQPGFWRRLAYEGDTRKPGYYEHPAGPGIGWYCRES